MGISSKTLLNFILQSLFLAFNVSEKQIHNNTNYKIIIDINCYTHFSPPLNSRED